MRERGGSSILDEIITKQIIACTQIHTEKHKRNSASHWAYARETLKTSHIGSLTTACRTLIHCRREKAANSPEWVPQDSSRRTSASCVCAEERMHLAPHKCFRTTPMSWAYAPMGYASVRVVLVHILDGTVVAAYVVVERSKTGCLPNSVRLCWSLMLVTDVGYWFLLCVRVDFWYVYEYILLWVGFCIFEKRVVVLDRVRHGPSVCDLYKYF
jgi:hypothetical protein